VVLGPRFETLAVRGDARKVNVVLSAVFQVRRVLPNFDVSVREPGDGNPLVDAINNP
jgi:hypothetical protein